MRAAFLVLAIASAACFAGAASSSVSLRGSIAAAPTLTGTSSASTPGRATSLSLARPAGTAAGDMMIAAIAARVPSAAQLTAPYGWKLLRADTNGSLGATLTQAVYTKLAGASEPASYSWLMSASRGAAGGILSYSGVDSATAVEAASGRFTANTNHPSAPSVTTSTATTILGFFSANATGSFSPPNDLYERYDVVAKAGSSSVKAEAATVNQLAGGATGDRVATSSSTDSSTIGQLVALRAAGSTAAPLPPPPSGGSSDTSPPSLPSNLAASSTSSSLSLTWSPASDNVGVAGYDAYLNGALAGTTLGTSYAFPGLSCGSSYTLAVEAFDAAGNRSGDATLAASTTACAPAADTSPPTAPSGLALASAGQTSLTLSWSGSSDNVGVAGYSAYLNGSLSGNTSATSYIFPALSCGTSYTLSVDAYDAALNRSTKAQLTASTAACSPPPPSGTLGTSIPARLPDSTGQVFYVATTGSDSNPGTLAAPWRTIQKAMNTLQPGQKALVRGGTYVETTTFSRAGTASAPITVAAYPGEQAIIHAPTSTTDNYPVDVTGSYFRLSGFVIENAQGYSCTNVYGDGSSHDIEISGNEIRASQDQGILTDEGTSKYQIIGNWIHNNGAGRSGQHQQHGIYLEGNDHLVANNVITDHPYGFGIQVYDRDSRSIITENTVTGAGYSGIVIGGSYGVDHIQVIGNIFAYNKQYGISHDSVNPTASRADHNITWGNGSGSIQPGFAGMDFSGGNTNADPLFASYTARDMHLQLGSPAVDKALPDYSEPFDFDLLSRPRGAGVDAGACER